MVAFSRKEKLIQFYFSWLYLRRFIRFKGSGFYFQIGAMKDMYGQLQANPKVEACFWRPDETTGTMMRVAGKIEFVDDPELKKKVLEDRPFLKTFGLTFDHPGLIIFRIAKGEAYFWTMATNLELKNSLNSVIEIFS